MTIAAPAWRDGRVGRLLRRGSTAGIAFFARACQQIATFVLTLLAARFLLPGEYGVYTLAIVFVTLIQTLTYTGYFHYVVTATGEARRILDTTFWLITGLATAGALTLALMAPAIASAFRAPELADVLRALALIQPLAAGTAWCSAVLMRERRLRLHFSILVAQNLIALACGVAILAAWQSVFALVAFRYIRVLTGALLYFGVGRTWPGLAWDRGLALAATRFASGLYGTRFLTFLTNYGADLILGVMFSTAEAGLYRFGNRLATAALDIVAQPMRSFALTQFGAADREDAPFGPVLRRILGTTVVLTGCVAGTIFVFGGDVMARFFDPAYAPGLVVTYALTARGLLGVGGSLVEPVLAARGRTGSAMVYYLVCASVQVAAAFFAAPFGLGILAWSQAAVALATTSGGIVLIARAGDVAVRPAVASAAKGVALAALYGAVAAGLWWLTRDLFGRDLGALAAGVLLAAAAAVATLAAAARLRVFDLRAFTD